MATVREGFMRKNRLKTKKPLAEINVVPYIDVMLVLLVIFMITAPLLTQGINVNLPKAQAKAIVAKNNLPVIVSVDRAGHYYLNTEPQPTKPISAVELMTQIAARVQIAKQQHKQLPVYVKGDRNVDYGKVVQAMVLLQHAGAQDVGLLTSPNHNDRS
jgi:biopolymer transport protein TolR